MNLHSMVFTLIEEREVVTIINSLNNSSPAVLVKRVMHFYIKPLTLIINNALYDGIFPKELKLAKVKTVFKAGA